ncbi:T9SS type A sorting domain-containing protein [candidate division KSB1 bacterium]|nr:T9SS type A sorting domain-containing protein [candidate division KSB1 bacterium]
MNKLYLKFFQLFSLIALLGFVVNLQAMNNQDLSQILKATASTIQGQSSEFSKPVSHMLTVLIDEERPNSKNFLTRKSYTVTENLVIESITQIWQNGAWVNEYKDILSYVDDEMYVPLAFESYIWENEDWQKEGLVEFTYENSLLTSMTMSIWSDGAWVLFMQTQNEYDGTQLIHIYTKMDIEGAGNLENMTKSDLFYDGNGVLVSQTHYIWAENDWMKNSETTFVYNAQGLLAEETETLDAGGVPFPTSKTLYTYTTAQLVESITHQGYDFITAGWNNESKESNSYDGSGQILEELYQEWDGSAWVNVRIIISSYNGSATSSILYQNWNGSAWENENRDTYIWSGDLLSEILTEVWLDNTWQNEERSLMNYAPTSVATNAKIPTQFAISNYPNPFNPETTISYSLPQNATITIDIIDMQGRRIRRLADTVEETAGTHAINWNGQNEKGQSVASGIYFYRLTASNISKTGRCLLLR